MKKERETWKNGMEFLFSCVAVCVGLGNIWRFPYICYKNGGGAFLIPYFLFLFIIAIPQILLQFSYPQYCSQGPAKAWICCPLFRGIGVAMIAKNAIVAVYYNVIIAWTVYYLANCFTTRVPWNSCDNYWNTIHCYSRVHGFGNLSTSIHNSSNNEALSVALNGSIWHPEKSKTATEEFWQYNVLELSGDINSIGQVRWPILLCNLTVCVVVFLCVFKGIKISGKIMYVAATIPYIFLIILLIKGLTMKGALVGLRHFFIPRWEKLSKFSVWVDASAQVIFSVGLGAGDNVVLASHNMFHHNVYRDAFVIPLIDAFTSLLAGCVIFVTLGYMSETFNLDFSTIVADGPGIAFMVFPEALSTLPLPQLWSALFFLTLLTVGIGSRIVQTQVVTSMFSDLYPDIFRSRLKWTTGLVCILIFILGIPYVCQGGMYVLQLVDWYVASVASILIIFLESSVLGWIYGAARLRRDIALMVGFPIPKLWDFLWKYVTPGCALSIWLFSMIHHRPVTYGDKVYPSWSIGVGWIIALVPILPLPGFFIWTLVKQEGTFLQRLRSSVASTPYWKRNERAALELQDCHQELNDETSFN